jgi:hypothetical protein
MQTRKALCTLATLAAAAFLGACTGNPPPCCAAPPPPPPPPPPCVQFGGPRGPEHAGPGPGDQPGLLTAGPAAQQPGQPGVGGPGPQGIQPGAGGPPGGQGGPQGGPQTMGQGAPPMFGPHGAPRELVEVCAGKKVNDACVVRKDGWELKGTCRGGPQPAADAPLACTPPQPKPQAAPAGPKPPQR